MPTIHDSARPLTDADEATLGRSTVRPFLDISRAEVGWAGGKGANLGELTRAHFPVPPGFVVGAPAYAAVCDAEDLRPRLSALLQDLDVEDSLALAAASKAARELIDEAEIPEPVAQAIRDAYAELGDGVAVAVRSSATAEDTAELSFAGMHDSFLNVRGTDALLGAIRACWRSLFGARTIYYRAKQGMPQAGMDIAVVVQLQIDSKRSGVMFTSDPVTGDPDALTIEASVGLGETIVSGQVTPDRYVIRKRDGEVLLRSLEHKELAIEVDGSGGTRSRTLDPDEAAGSSLGDADVVALCKLGHDVEAHYGTPQDVEWAIDDAGAFWLVQSRPITTLGSHAEAQAPQAGTLLVRGLAASPGQAAGPVRIILSPLDGADLVDGEVLVAPMTTPDWVPLLRRASALVTDSGGITCHAAIVARELGIPAVVGTTNATQVLKDGQRVAVDGARGVVMPATAAGLATTPVVASAQATNPVAVAPAAPPITGTKVLLNLSDPGGAAAAAELPSDGVGLLRAELMMVHALGGDHPQMLVDEGRTAEAIERMTSSIETFAIAFAGRPVTYRSIDFRSNEFRGLRGGEAVEPQEANPMIGLRGALRALLHPEVFQLELAALNAVWDRGGTNVRLMLPFVRSANEFERCRELVAQSGLLDRRGFELWVMAEVPSVLFELDRYAALGVAGISVGSNDLTQLLMAADRDSALVSEAFDTASPAVLEYLDQLLGRASELGLQTSICGQAASVDGVVVERLVQAGIGSVSVTPDALQRTRRVVASSEQRLLLRAARLSLGATR